ncbi:MULTISPECIES: cupin domain-containing protein [Desulfosporosinus]|uniref:Cupin domain protein n=1 Tax=Desulfosporosinus acididurans TaxID=476652 RepID=A0A0J1FPQ1_9FIRM|nr:MULTISPECIES: cupin domain-containing protein [Desulfosporosinus]KLU64933.1 cupin domain protein [Desulfosporosinus acididurans]
MIKKAEDLRVEYSPNLKDGKGTVKIINILENKDNHGTGRLFGVSIIPVGGSIGKHQHVGDFETYYILKGKALVNDNGQEQILGPGDMTHCNDGDYHSIENIGDCDLEYIAVILYTKQKEQ